MFYRSKLASLSINPRTPILTPFEKIQAMMEHFNKQMDAKVVDTEFNQGKHHQCLQKLFNERIFPILNKCWALSMKGDTPLTVEYQSITLPHPHMVNGRIRPVVKKETVFKKENRHIVIDVSLLCFGRRSVKYLLFEIWVQHLQRREVRITFHPLDDQKAMERQVKYSDSDRARNVGIVNLFEGIPAALEVLQHIPVYTPEQLETDTIYRHLKYVICGGNQETTVYVCKWLAYVIQKRAKSEVGLVLAGEHGCGKSKFVEKLAQMFGKYYYPLLNFDDLALSGDELNYALLVFADELKQLTESKYQRLKAYISNDQQQMRAPHKKSELHYDFSNMIIATNNTNEIGRLIPIEHSERRFVFLNCTTQYLASDPDTRRIYFSQLIDADVRPFARFLYSITPIVRGQVFITEETLAVKKQNMDSFASWWYWCLRNGRITKTRQDNQRHDIFCWLNVDYVRQGKPGKAKLYDSYRDFCTASNMAGKTIDSNMFGRRMKSYDIGAEGRCNSNERFIRINSLAHCRSVFIRIMGALNWFDNDGIAEEAERVRLEAISKGSITSLSSEQAIEDEVFRDMPTFIDEDDQTPGTPSSVSSYGYESGSDSGNDTDTSNEIERLRDRIEMESLGSSQEKPVKTPIIDQDEIQQCKKYVSEEKYDQLKTYTAPAIKSSIYHRCGSKRLAASFIDQLFEQMISKKSFEALWNGIVFSSAVLEFLAAVEKSGQTIHAIAEEEEKEMADADA